MRRARYVQRKYVLQQILTIPLQTALQVYAKNYKQAPTANIHGLLRKALRLDSILHTDESDSEASQDSTIPHCSRCQTEFSPRFYPTPPSTPDARTESSSSSETWLCHRCHYIVAHDNKDSMRGVVVNGVNGIMSS